jgi:hypothetical protein
MDIEKNREILSIMCKQFIIMATKMYFKNQISEQEFNSIIELKKMFLRKCG